ncbi:uncharacterized protein [Musca autumnalis]|uniref:uncharacterized protein n=1 Tax=Musca autumnalis TaxID=221902 RepID=UPI003CEB79E4
MRLFVFIFVVIVSVFSEELEPNSWCSDSFLENIVFKCLEEYNGILADAYDFMYLRPAANERMKCFRACLFNECLSFNSDGNFAANVPATTAFWTSRRNSSYLQIVEEAAENCINSLGDEATICDLTDAYITCLGENTPHEITFRGAFNLD